MYLFSFGVIYTIAKEKYIQHLYASNLLFSEKIVSLHNYPRQCKILEIDAEKYQNPLETGMLKQIIILCVNIS